MSISRQNTCLLKSKRLMSTNIVSPRHAITNRSNISIMMSIRLRMYTTRKITKKANTLRAVAVDAVKNSIRRKATRSRLQVETLALLTNRKVLVKSLVRTSIAMSPNRREVTVALTSRPGIQGHKRKEAAKERKESLRHPKKQGSPVQASRCLVLPTNKRRLKVRTPNLLHKRRAITVSAILKTIE